MQPWHQHHQSSLTTASGTSLAPSSASCCTNTSTSRRRRSTTTLRTVARASAQESVLRTKETREAEAAKRRRVYRKALIRVRFADGLMLQATFSVKAPVSRLLRWVADSLREPHHPFELSIARGETLDDPAKTIEQVPPTRPSTHALGRSPRRVLSADPLSDSSRRRWTSRRRRCSTSAYPRPSSSTRRTFAPTFARPSSNSPTRRYRKDRAGSRTRRRAPTCHRRTLSRARCRSGPRAVLSSLRKIARGRLARLKLEGCARDTGRGCAPRRCRAIYNLRYGILQLANRTFKAAFTLPVLLLHRVYA